jgi:hypothetical protein
LKASGPLRIRKNDNQNVPTDAFTKRLSHEFRRKIETPSAIKVTALITVRRSAADDRMGRFGWTSIENSCLSLRKPGTDQEAAEQQPELSPRRVCEPWVDENKLIRAA